MQEPSLEQSRKKEEDGLKDGEVLWDARYTDPEGSSAGNKTQSTFSDNDPANLHISEMIDTVCSSSDDESPEDDADDAKIDKNIDAKNENVLDLNDNEEYTFSCSEKNPEDQVDG